MFYSILLRILREGFKNWINYFRGFFFSNYILRSLHYTLFVDQQLTEKNRRSFKTCIPHHVPDVIHQNWFIWSTGLWCPNQVNMAAIECCLAFFTQFPPCQTSFEAALWWISLTRTGCMAMFRKTINHYLELLGIWACTACYYAQRKWESPCPRHVPDL